MIEEPLLRTPHGFRRSVPRGPGFSSGRRGFDLSGLCRFQLLIAPVGALIVRIRRGRQELQIGATQLSASTGRFEALLPLPLNGGTMDLQASRERFDRRQQPLLQADDQQPRRCLRSPRGAGQPLLTGLPVLVQKA